MHPRVVKRIFRGRPFSPGLVHTGDPGGYSVDFIHNGLQPRGLPLRLGKLRLGVSFDLAYRSACFGDIQPILSPVHMHLT